MATLAGLRKEAKALGIPTPAIRGATTAPELEEVIAAFSGQGSGNSKPRKKATVRKKATKGRTVKRTTSRKSAPAAKSTQGKAKRPTATTKRASKAAASNGNKGGRHLLEAVEYDPLMEGWNAREGSAPDMIIRALKKFRGNREKVFTSLLPHIGDFMGMRKRDGSKRTKSERENMLRYRISRTAWEYAVRTGQHDPSQNREKYGTAGTGMGTWVPSDLRPVKRASQKRSAAPVARKVSQTSRKRATSQKRSQGVRRATTAKRATAKRTSVKRRTIKRRSVR